MTTYHFHITHLTSPKPSNTHIQGQESSFCGRCRQRGHITGQCSAVVCDYCGRRGHHADQCRTRQAEETRRLECSCCFRRGHEVSRCYTRASESRKEHLLRAVLSERYQPTPPQQAPYRADLTATPRLCLATTTSTASSHPTTAIA